MDKHLWGTEQTLVNNELYCMKYFILFSGSKSSLHKHNKKDETFYVEDGTILLELDGKEVILKRNDSQRIKPGQLHRFQALSVTATMFEVSTHDDTKDNIKEVPACEVKDD